MQRAAAKSILGRLRELSRFCRVCPRECGAMRLDGETGACGAGRIPGLFMHYVHWAEDADITPAQTLYLAGCNLDCVFCQTGIERRTLPARGLTAGVLRGILAEGRRAGARTLDILGGEPTVNVLGVMEALAGVNDFPGLVWNTNLYGTAEIFALLDRVVDTYVGDVKFGGAACAARLCGVADAGAVAMKRASEIHARRPGALIVRHLVMPGHFACCTEPVLRWIAAALPGARVSLRTGYLPPPGAGPESAFLPRDEAARARDCAERLGLPLTRDAVLPVTGPGGGGKGGEFEVTLAPDGTVYLRHVTREAAALLDALSNGPAENDRGGG